MYISSLWHSAMCSFYGVFCLSQIQSPNGFSVLGCFLPPCVFISGDFSDSRVRVCVLALGAKIKLWPSASVLPRRAKTLAGAVCLTRRLAVRTASWRLSGVPCTHLVKISRGSSAKAVRSCAFLEDGGCAAPYAHHTAASAGS